MNIKETKKRGKFRRFGALVLALAMIFGSATPAIAVAAETPTVVEEPAEKPAAKSAETSKEAPAKTEEQAPAKAAEAAPAQAEQVPAKTEEKPVVETQAAPAKAQKNAPAEDGLEISPESTPERVGAVDPNDVKKPNVNKISAGEKTVSGTLGTGQGRRLAKKLDFTIKVTVNRQAGGSEEKTFTILHGNRKQGWSVTFTEPLEVGDQVVVAQLVRGEGDATDTQIPAEPIKFDVRNLIANDYKDKLIMPSVTIQPEDPFIPENEYREMLIHAIKKLNKDKYPDIVNQLPIKRKDIGDKKDMITTLNCTSGSDIITLTFSDGSTGEFKAPGLHISAPQERTAQPKVDKIYFTDNAVKGQLAEGTVVKKTFTDDAIANAWTYDIKTKISYVLRINDEQANFCVDSNCGINKNDDGQILVAQLNDDGSFSGTIVPNSDDKKTSIDWSHKVGIKITEPGKKPTCMQVSTHIVVPTPTPVRDPRKLTENDKKAIDQAIRDANTAGSVSKLPDGTGFNKAPAIIEFDTKGNARIISPNNVEVDHWDTSSGTRKPVFATNPDGTYKVKDESQVITIPADKLVRNIGPRETTFAVQPSKGTVTVTPPAYKASGDDTDLDQYTLTYHDAQGNKKTITAKRDSETDKWSGDGVNETDGTITLKVDDLALGDTFTTVTKDKGGIAEGDTDPKTQETTHELPKVKLTFEKGDVNATGAMDAQEVNQGGKFTLPANGFTRPPYKKFKGWSVNGESENLVEKIDHVESDTTITAVWEPIKVTVTYDAGKGGSGTMDGLTENSETVEAGTFYNFKPNTFVAPDHKEFDTWSIAGARVTADGVQLEEADITVTALWKYKDVKVTYKPGDGSGPDKDDTAKESQDYKVKENSFTAPENKEFHHWLANVWQQTDTEDLKKDPGAILKIYKETEFTAQWKFIQVDIVYQPGDHGNGKDVPKQADKNQDFLIDDVRFEPDTNYKFIGWRQINPQTLEQKLYQPGDKVNAGTGKVFEAQWELMERTITVDPGRGEGTPYPKTMIVGEKFKLPQPAPFQAPKNEEFSHWTVGNEAKKYKIGEEFEVKDNVTVTAQWKPIEWTVTEDPGEVGKEQKTTNTVNQGTTYTVPASDKFTAKEPEKYEFSHWTVNGEKKDPGTEIVIKGKTEVVAHWKIQKKTVTYENGGGKGKMDPVTEDYGTRFTLPQPTFEAPNENQEFSHWEITGDSEPRQPGYAFDLTKNITVKAVWKDSAFTVTYEPGLVGSGTKAPVTVLKKAPTHELAPANTFTPYEGFEFEGWEIDGKSYEPGFAYTVTKNTTVTAKWRPKTIKLTFVSGIGSEDGNIEKRTTQGGRYYLPNSEFKAKEGYQFRGWEINGVEKKVGDSVSTDQDVTITALWDKLVKVHYDANGGDWSGLRRKTESVPENKPFQLSYAPKRDGYIFDGWQAQGERKMYARATHPGTATEMTFVAQWRERGTSGGSGNTPGIPPVTPGTEPSTPPVTPGTEPSTPPVTPGTEPGTPSMPSDGGIPNRDALLRRLRSLWNSSEMRRLLEESAKKGQNGTAIPRAGVGTAERTVSTLLFPVDLLPAKKREDD